MKIWTCEGERRTGCGGGKRGGHVIDKLQKSKEAAETAAAKATIKLNEALAAKEKRDEARARMGAERKQRSAQERAERREKAKSERNAQRQEARERASRERSENTLQTRGEALASVRARKGRKRS